MKKKRMILFLTLAVMLLWGTMSVRADWMTTVDYTENLIVPAGNGYLMPLKMFKGGKNLKASCKQDIGVDVWSEKESNTGYPLLDIRSRKKDGTFIKSGKGTVTVNGTVKGKSKTVKIKFRLVNAKYVCPVKSVKFGSYNATKKFKTTSHWPLLDEYDEKTGIQTPNPTWKEIAGKKIQVKPASGWKLVKITQAVGDKVYTLKSGKKLRSWDLGKQYVRISLYLQNKKSGLLRILTIA